MMLPTRLKFNGQILFINLPKKIKKEIHINSQLPLYFFLEEFCVIFGACFNQNLTICVQQGEKQQH